MNTSSQSKHIANKYYTVCNVLLTSIVINSTDKNKHEIHNAPKGMCK